MFTIANKSRIQPKLTIGQPNDRYEQEADQVADQVMKMSTSQIPSLQLKCAKCEEEELQMKPLSKTIEPIIQKQEEEPITRQGNRDANQQMALSQLCNRTFTTSEEAQRQSIYEGFIRGLTGVNSSVERVIKISMCRFSLRQLSKMSRAGLRIWTHGSVPSVFEGVVQINSRGGSASYVRGIRTIFLRETINTAWLTHEMAHAWDHIRIIPRRNLVRLENLNSRRRRRLILNPGNYLSETSRRQNIDRIGARRPTRMTFDRMFQNYRRRVPRRELAFSQGSRTGYSMTSSQEFYAEGYTVFQGSFIGQQAKLYNYAIELYNFLNNEANREQMPTPNLNAVIQEARQLPRARPI
ncbi:hypothetical protein D1818_23330 [Aquimarina sp. BL5]|uniref:hypothetical protein n=1 Tax=Aquimarina sp. BL5 TaxID=1714860 RepID=UPI000E54E9E0|nr:hypothetical protein [Aquimarina sp. BL5]AXT53612.1 hypothetical protein D1818_23330 [Aquimarina sp. BL5]RKM97617.1 hypothetical protein D7036_20450 [Aquimarina sp. BL5]